MQQASITGDRNTLVVAHGNDIRIRIGPEDNRLELACRHRRVLTVRKDLDLLNPFARAIPLVGRDAELASLQAWLRATPPSPSAASPAGLAAARPASPSSCAPGRKRSPSPPAGTPASPPPPRRPLRTCAASPPLPTGAGPPAASSSSTTRPPRPASCVTCSSPCSTGRTTPKARSASCSSSATLTAISGGGPS